MKILIFTLGLLVSIYTTAASTQKYAGKQTELCMIGDSITWAFEGDDWRKFLLEKLPSLAFIGTHSAKNGFSHAGEGGNTTRQVIARLAEIPSARYYHLLIGTNDNRVVRNKAELNKVALKTYKNIIKIVRHLAARKGTEKVFLGSILPCTNGKYPFRDQTNMKTNQLLRKNFANLFPDGKIVWVEYEKPLRGVKGWEKIIRLHPTTGGYRILASILAKKLKTETRPANKTIKGICGVKVINLWKGNADGSTTQAVLPGWYTLSFKVKRLKTNPLKFTLESSDKKLKFVFNQKFAKNGVKNGDRVSFNFFTGYEGYGYNACYFLIKNLNAEIKNIMLEKLRPAKRPSIFKTGTFIDTKSPASLGELLLPIK
jgi:lysophospholipase L1-like esterase